MKWEVEYIMDWITRMGEKHGHTIYARGKRLDWGQALCTQLYGDDPKEWPESPGSVDVNEASSWESGNLPQWVKEAIMEVAR